VDEETSMPQIDIYTQDFCPYCARALRFFAEKGLAVNEIYAPRGSAAREEAVRRSGGRGTVPQIFIDGRHIGGCDDLLALDRKGELEPLLHTA
jgi:glutaredoxin 3